MSNPSKEDVTKIEVRIAPIVRTGETADVKRARLLYQSRKRGILETDLLLSKFAKLYLADMTMEEMEEYDKLLDEQDWDIYYWATEAEGQPPAPERWNNSAILQKLRVMSKNGEREIMRMANLY